MRTTFALHGARVKQSAGERPQDDGMKINDRRCLVCDCEGTMPLTAEALGEAFGVAPQKVHRQLCRAELGALGRAAAGGEVLLIGCTQEAPVFTEALGGDEAPPHAFVNIRERAGWSVEAAQAAPKIAALLAEAALDPPPPAPAVAMRSSGRCLVVGAGETALAVARQLASRLDVTLLLTGGADLLPPPVGEIPIFRGSVRHLSGHLGAFRLEVANLAAALVSSRAALRFGPAQATASLDADLVVDLSGGQPLLTGHTKRDGYLRPDPRDPLAVQRALFAATDLVGEFEKPRYIAFSEELCAHSRSRRTGCTRCLEQCPTGAITPAGDHVRIDPHVCAGCGSCAGVCPTGAASYAAPTANVLLDRLRVLLDTYHAAGGRDAALLVHEARHGDELIDLMARLGRGLPARVLPLAVSEITQLGLEFLAAAFAYGANSTLILVPPAKLHEAAGLQSNIGYLHTALDALGYGADRLRFVVENDAEALEAALYGLPRHPATQAAAFLAMGGKRTLLRLALDHLHEAAPAPVDLVPLPAGAPLGSLQIDVEGCTLCLACVGACPTSALRDSPDRPMLSFVEDACVQCGLCQNTCPERVIRLDPRLNFTPGAKAARMVKEEEPALCVRCGKAFGTRSTVERVVAQLSRKHYMFQDPEQVALIRMCDDCRVKSQYEVKDNPLQFGERPRIRTTDDYLRERAAAAEAGKPDRERH